MKKLLGGLDIGSEEHHVIIMNDKEKILYDRKIAHKFSEFYEAIKEIRKIEGREKGKILQKLDEKSASMIPSYHSFRVFH